MVIFPKKIIHFFVTLSNGGERMKEKKIISQDGCFYVPYRGTVFCVEEGDENAWITAIIGERKYKMWEGKKEEARRELAYAMNYCAGCFSYHYKMGTENKKKKK